MGVVGGEHLPRRRAMLQAAMPRGDSPQEVHALLQAVQLLRCRRHQALPLHVQVQHLHLRSDSVLRFSAQLQPLESRLRLCKGGNELCAKHLAAWQSRLPEFGSVEAGSGGIAYLHLGGCDFTVAKQLRRDWSVCGLQYCSSTACKLDNVPT